MPTIYNLPAGVRFEQVEFRLIVPKSANRMIGRFTEKRRYGTPYWLAQYRTAYLEEFGVVSAWFKRLDTRDGVFRAYDVERPRPRAHDLRVPLSGTKAGGGAFDGTAEIQSITNSRTIVVNGLPANFQFREDDYVEVREGESGAIISLHAIDADVQANGSGVVTLSINPPLDTQNFTTAATVNFEKPSCLMQLEAGALPKSWNDRNASFSGEEVFFYESEE